MLVKFREKVDITPKTLKDSWRWIFVHLLKKVCKYLPLQLIVLFFFDIPHKIEYIACFDILSLFFKFWHLVADKHLPDLILHQIIYLDPLLLYQPIKLHRLSPLLILTLQPSNQLLNNLYFKGHILTWYFG